MSAKKPSRSPKRNSPKNAGRPSASGRIHKGRGRPLASGNARGRSAATAPSSFNTLVMALLKDVLQEQKPLDRSYAFHFSRNEMTPIEQGRIVNATGDILRRLNFYLFIAELDDALDVKAPERLLLAWLTEQGRAPRQQGKGSKTGFSIDKRRITEANQWPLLKDGCPEWLDKIAQQQLGQRWPLEREFLAQAPLRYIRVNQLKGTREQLQQQFRTEQIPNEAVDKQPDALIIRGDVPLFRSKSFHDGWFEQQDLGSQHIARMLNPKPGMLTVDACAGTGGKTLHIAALMQNKGRIIAMDVEQRKLDQLRKRAKRTGVNNLETRLIESSTQIKRLRASADRVLLDVPCSGLGVLRRNPEAKWNPLFEDLEQLCATQQDILQRYSKMAKVGGEVVYATCSILPMENQDQVAHFLENCSGAFELLEEKTILPSALNSDGFYMARLKRTA
ncbi:RsmB/NOP family class I SAM-dependent RNA methyltransferase [Oceanospirillum sanctuarii]|uniref:RsmB/NOP family class I SAM-dependent RNA methyltransferase n=1 Tax=Oceanospirillum sanctuarii TaxID=1434821 RepID=UPI001C3E0CFF|nr:RsmB/NOP family class I SAM-dependent RNA methyltransferase [Oceanospirillum sanctuarii]